MLSCSIIWAALLIALMVAVPAAADRPGSSAGQFLMLGPGARPAALGNAYTAIADGANASYWNPAGLARLRESEVMFMYSRWFQDVDYNHLAYVHGTPIFSGNLGGNVTFLDYGSIDITGISNQAPVTGMGQTDASDLAVTVGYGQRGELFDWGVNLKYIRESIASQQDDAMAVDLGVLLNLTPMREISFGATVMNLGTKLRLQQESNELPLTFKLGAVYEPPDFPLLLTMDCIIPQDDRVQVAVGGEWRVVEMLALRVGYNSENEAGSGLTAGIGFNIHDEFSIDYAYVPYGEIGDAHRLSLTYRFGPVARQEPGQYYRMPNPAPAAGYGSGNRERVYPASSTAPPAVGYQSAPPTAAERRPK